VIGLINPSTVRSTPTRWTVLFRQGIVAKRRDKPYRSGRSPDWIKVKNPDAPAATRVIEW
jgi:hypothetical protein